MPKKVLSVRIDEHTYDVLNHYSKCLNLSLSNYVSKMLDLAVGGMEVQDKEVGLNGKENIKTN